MAPADLLLTAADLGVGWTEVEADVTPGDLGQFDVCGGETELGRAPRAESAVFTSGVDRNVVQSVAVFDAPTDASRVLSTMTEAAASCPGGWKEITERTGLELEYGLEAVEFDTPLGDEELGLRIWTEGASRADDSGVATHTPASVVVRAARRGSTVVLLYVYNNQEVDEPGAAAVIETLSRLVAERW